MEANGALKVNEFGQVEGFDDVFALGDCCNAKEMKLAMVAKLQADHVLRNIGNMFHKRSLEPWHKGECFVQDTWG
jgi:NADH dehydrogenase FAD-containing subunit